MRQIIPCLWFDSNAEEAANYYVSLFKDSKIVAVTRFGDAGREVHGRPSGSVMTVSFEINGQRYSALNGGPIFKQTEAVSFVIACDSQQELDEYWEKLSAGGDPAAQQCGWLKDKFGVSWQVVPADLERMFIEATPAQADRLMSAILEMKKLDLHKLQTTIQD